MQGPESDASTLATSACPAGPENEPTRGRMVGGSGPSVVRVEAVGVCRTAVDGGSLLVPSCLEWLQAVSGYLMSAATYNQPFLITGASSRCSESDSLEAAPRDVTSPRRVATNRHKRRIEITHVHQRCQAPLSVICFIVATVLPDAPIVFRIETR
jgi:hypothetical protein